MTHIVPLSQISEDAVETLLDAAFGADRKARTAYKMRSGCRAIELLSFAALDSDGTLMGTLQSWPVALEGEDGVHTVMTLVGPVAVAPDLQRSGIGKVLMQQLVDAADDHGHKVLVMIGDPEYYGRFFGFTADATGGWMVPGPVERHRLLAKIKRVGGMPQHGRIIPNP
ncbi:MAG: N-acetyltransferase [Chakrabartia sp.]